MQKAEEVRKKEEEEGGEKVGSAQGRRQPAGEGGAQGGRMGASYSTPAPSLLAFKGAAGNLSYQSEMLPSGSHLAVAEFSLNGMASREQL